MNMFIGLGGWCGTSFGLKGSNLRTCSLPFDWVRSKFSGIIHCIETDFKDFLPETYVPDFHSAWDVYRGSRITFFHDDFQGKPDVETAKYNRRIQRFIQLLSTEKKIVFVRTTITKDYHDETNLAEKFHSIMSTRYPELDYRLIYVIPEQSTTGFMSCVDEKTYCYTVNDRSHKNDNLGEEYAPIFEMLQKFDPFTSVPDTKITDKIIFKSRFLVTRHPTIPKATTNIFTE